MVFVAMDDTDMPGTRGTGRLARKIAAQLTRVADVVGVSRHQLLRHPDVPMTKNNSANVIHLGSIRTENTVIADMVQASMLDEYLDGSDPGLCVSRHPTAAMTAFGRLAKQRLVTRDAALRVAAGPGTLTRMLGGTNDGIIGAVAAAGLAASGEDGRFVQIGSVRDLTGDRPVRDVVAAGVTRLQTVDGEVVTEGEVATGGRARPEIIGGNPVLLVRADPDGKWQPVRRD